MSTHCARGWREENLTIFSTATAQLLTVMERKSEVHNLFVPEQFFVRRSGKTPGKGAGEVAAKAM